MECGHLAQLSTMYVYGPQINLGYTCYAGMWTSCQHLNHTALCTSHELLQCIGNTRHTDMHALVFRVSLSMASEWRLACGLTQHVVCRSRSNNGGNPSHFTNTRCYHCVIHTTRISAHCSLNLSPM